MPFKSEAQRRLMYAASRHQNGLDGIRRKVAAEFVANDRAGKLPEKTEKRKSLYYKDR